MFNYLIAITTILFLLLGWLTIQSIARRFAIKHPEFGTYREEGKGCGDSCSCADKCTSSMRNEHTHSQGNLATLQFNKIKGDYHE